MIIFSEIRSLNLISWWEDHSPFQATPRLGNYRVVTLWFQHRWYIVKYCPNLTIYYALGSVGLLFAGNLHCLLKSFSIWLILHLDYTLRAFPCPGYQAYQWFSHCTLFSLQTAHRCSHWLWSSYSWVAS